ncbi:hypothetical protein niasHT_022506 [Heterodera trifolii]|uniref:Uncharacterized protein n=1 Tax=Heterodera trifolii TaxID=157864 RepID=A0ABD2JH63_9BILA
MIYPTKFSWVAVDDCVCPVKDNLCVRPTGYSKPVICAHKLVHNITGLLSSPPIPIASTPDPGASESVLVLTLL